MRIEKWGVLLSYAIYLVFCIVFSIVDRDSPAVDTIIFAITIASTFFAISDIMFTKLEIDKKERESLFSLYYLTGYARKFYMNQIMEKYNKKASNMVSVLMDFFEGDELEKFFSGNLSVKEKEDFLNKIKLLSNNEVTNFVEGFLKSDNDEIIKENEDDKKSISEIFSKRKKKEDINYWIASSIAIIGLIALLIILAIRIKSIYYINNVFTGVAFLSVIINLLLKEYYKTSSLKKITEEKNKLLKNIGKQKDSDFLDKSNPNSNLKFSIINSKFVGENICVKNTKKSEEITSNDDKIDNQQKGKGAEECDKVINKIQLQTKENDVNIPETTITDSDFRKDTEMEPTIKDNKKEKKRTHIGIFNMATLVFSFLLVWVGVAQYRTYNRQANIAANANKLAQYQYRFKFYEKLEDLQKDVSIIKKKPQLDIEQFSELNYKILFLYRESELLFDKNISRDINKILNEHLNFLTELNNRGMSYDDYKNEMSKLNTKYGNFINSDNFKKYLDINTIE